MLGSSTIGNYSDDFYLGKKVSVSIGFFFFPYEIKHWCYGEMYRKLNYKDAILQLRFIITSYWNTKFRDLHLTFIAEPSSGGEILSSVLQSSFCVCTNIYGSKNYVLEDCNIIVS